MRRYLYVISGCKVTRCTWILVVILFLNTKLLNLECGAYMSDIYSTSPFHCCYVKFKHNMYNFTIAENSFGRTYAKSIYSEDYPALSVDIGLQVHYKIASGDQDKYFKAEGRVVGDLSFLTIRTRTNNVILNREKRDEYLLKITALISCSHRQNKTTCEAETFARITVLDRNDLSPLFYTSEYTVSISEDMGLYQSVLKVTAEDADLGMNGEIYYSFLLDYEFFAIHPTTGIISLMKKLCYEQTSIFDLIVLANDRGHSSIYQHPSNKAKVTVYVKKENLHSPEIFVTALESVTSSVVGALYGVVKVIDKDVGRNGIIKTMEIVNGDPENVFQVVPTSNKNEFYIKVSKYAILPKPPFIYNLTMRAEDDGVLSRQTFKNILVPIFSVQENLPVFTKEIYEVSIPETSPPSMPIIRLKVMEPFYQKNYAISLKIVGGNEENTFKINPDSGMLYTQKRLDAEKRSLYTLTISAVDQTNLRPEKQSSAKVKISIEDMNDNDPLFDHINRTIFIRENEPVGTIVAKLTARDKDSGENSYISYSITNLNDVPFEIDHFTGIIKITKLIDYETMRRVYILNVRASDWGLPYRRQTEEEVVITITDINDNRPQFEKINCTGVVQQNTPIGKSIFTISAIDFDYGDLITYGIISGSEDACFNIEPTTGVLSVGCDLTDVELRYRQIKVFASDGSHISNEFMLTVRIINTSPINYFNPYSNIDCFETGVASRLAEIITYGKRSNTNYSQQTSNYLTLSPSRYGDNIHSPEFDKFPQKIVINENLSLGEVVTKIQASDRDLGYNGKLVYAILDGDYDSVFRIDQDTGEIQIIGYLDRERQDEYLLNITVFDMGLPNKSTSKILSVSILDNNDNQPIFQKHHTVLQLSEIVLNNSEVLCLNASDTDLGKNSMIKYFIQPTIKDFRINEDNGCVYTNKPLDRETQDNYQLHIIAKDGGIPSLSSEALVNIFIQDINDNFPIFGVQEFLFKVREDIPIGTVIGLIEANDFDTGLNGDIHYFLKYENLHEEEVFKIDKLTGVIRTINYLDYESRQIHNLLISAADLGTPSLTTYIAVVVEVIDINENRFPPEFDDFVFVTNAKEDAPRGSIIANITAKDLDTSDSDSKISYTIRGGNGIGVFSVNDQGSIYILSQLDAETINSYWITLCAQDHGIVPLSSCVQVYVFVENVNDNVPLTDLPEYYTSVLEESQPYTKIIQLQALDADNDPFSIITYKIMPGNSEKFFLINATTGEIVTSELKLDRENQAEHTIEISISDNNLLELTSITRVIVIVKDVNDHSPEFDNRFYRIEVISTSKINDSIYQVQAFDSDFGENSRITYSLKSGKGKNKFRIDSKTGTMYLLNYLDYAAEYDLIIRAEDNGSPKRMQTARMNIISFVISHASKHPPIIKTVDNVVKVTEGDPPGFFITLIQAGDEDGDRLWYTIKGGNDYNNFYIGRENGNVILVKQLDWEERRYHNLTITVTDGTYIVQTQLYIEVIDINDNRPEFTQKKYYINISENIDEETVVMHLHALDKDEENKIFYNLYAAQDPSSLSLFNLDSQSGIISLKHRLDYEKKSKHVLIAIAKDQGTPCKRSFSKIFINVLDHNNHFPEFSKRVIQSRIPESAAVGSKIIQVYAADRDDGKNGEVKYSIAAGNFGNIFALDQNLGILSISKPISNNEMVEFMIHIKATDLGDPPLSSQISVHLLITKSENDPPRFKTPIFVVEINENIPIGTYITQIETHSSSSVFYEITDGNNDSVFHINPSTGIIVSNYMIDFENRRVFNLTITAINMASLMSKQYVVIHILDQNDNAPYFLENTYEGEISESAKIGSLVFHLPAQNKRPLLIKASDRDFGINAMVEFLILDDIAKNYFKIDSSTGTIKLLKELDFEARSRFTFNIMVRDMGSPNLYSKTNGNVLIVVKNENDSPPVFEHKQKRIVLYLPTFNDVLVATVKANDADDEKNATIRYDIIDGNMNNCFDIDSSSGVVTTRNALHLNVFHIYNLHIRASDGIYSSIMQLDIHLEYVNNSGLIFQKHRYEFSVKENSSKISVIGLVNVFGNTLKENVEYAILNQSSMFSIGKSSGAIKTIGSVFDRESTDYYKLIIEAKSFLFNNFLQVRRSLTEVFISVLDENDNCPIFINLPYLTTVSLNDPEGTVLFKVKAVDLDYAENGAVRYEMKKGSGDFFKVDRTSGEIILKQNVGKQHKMFDLIITAYDGGVIPCFTDVSLNIKVVDKSIPTFEKQIYTLSIKEDVSLYTALSIAIKPLSPLRRDLILTISEGNHNDLFEIDYKTGVLYVINNLDYELQQSHTIKVRATDFISDTYAEVAVLISIEDTNDCYPSIEKDNYNVVVREDLNVGSFIIQIAAYDNDTSFNQKLSYSIENTYPKNSSDMFFIDAENGSLYTRKELDREKIAFYYLEIKVYDHGFPSLSSKTNVWITVQDLNDNIPQFMESTISCKLFKKAVGGQFVTIVKAHDLDLDNENLFYKLLDGNDLQNYEINNKSGIIRINNLHRYSQNYQTVLNISVTDGIHTSYSTVDIVINNENEEEPYCEKFMYEISVMENQNPGINILKITAVDPDFPKHSKLTYKILSRKMNEIFNISETSGLINTKCVFNREERMYYDFFVEVTDIGGKSGFCIVKVTIDDENDNSPTFTAIEYKTTVKINTPPNTTIVRVNAFDFDAGENGLVKYRLNQAKENIEKYLHLDNVDGRVILLQKPNKWQNKIVQFFIRAYDNGTPQLYNDVPVSIQFVDNDIEIPYFSNSEVNISILESALPGTVLTQLWISGNYSKIFLSDSNFSPFSISDTGIIMLTENLDREVKSLHRFVVTCKTVTIPIMYAQIEIFLYVQDENDNYPLFTSTEYYAEIPENTSKGTSVLKVTAIDEDDGLNADIYYYFEHEDSLTNIFDIDLYSGWITLTTQLDREIESYFKFYICASDNGNPKLTSKVPVVIKVLDYNDNPSLFQQENYEQFVFENTLPGTVLTQFILTDRDLKSNEVDFHIISGDVNAQFYIKPTGELLVSKPLDRELIARYNLTLLATDGKFISLSSIIIYIRDVNDNYPICLNSCYNLIINESIEIGTSLVKIRATDADEDAKLYYYLTGFQSDKFAMEKDTGILKVMKVIDREQNENYILKAHVKDGTNECISDIRIKVLDINDNEPQFSTQQFVVGINKKTQIHTVIAKVHATDKDLGLNKKILYTFLRNNSFFYMYPESGIITLVKNLETENVSHFNITVKAQDCGVPALSSITHLIINILDVNHNPPIFLSKEYNAFIPENTSINTEVTNVLALSQYTGVNNKMLYYIITGNDQKHFRINSTKGVIYVNDNLDYEKLNTYFLTIQVVDEGSPPLSSITLLKIHVLDINDNAPIFSQKIYRIKVHENIAVGKSILKLNAYDIDSIENGVIRYSIQNANNFKEFNINKLQGNIFTLKNLDRESIASYILNVSACDSGKTELCTYANVYIEVIDVNDNAPLFSSTNYSLIVQESKNIMLQFNISDSDEYPNSCPYTFHILNGNNDGQFFLTPNGSLKIISALNHKLCDLYNLQIRVFDNGTPPLHSDAWVNIQVIEESQYPPIITPLEITVNSFEDEFSGGYLGQLYISDQDIYDTIYFRITQTDDITGTQNLFYINESNGLLYAVGVLDVGVYNVNVTVSDGKYQRNSVVKVNVQLITAELVANSLTIRFNKISAKDFLLEHQKSFVRSISAVLRCHPKSVVIISLSNGTSNQGSNKTYRKKRITFSTLNVVFAIENQPQNIYENYTTEYIYSTVTNHIEEIEQDTKLLIEELRQPFCSKEMCSNGICANSIKLYKENFSTFDSNTVSFVAPRYEEIVKCVCKQGFIGNNCEKTVDVCTSDLCTSQKYCIPTKTSEGFECICPKELAGEYCDINTPDCSSKSCKNFTVVMSFGGNSYAHYKINNAFAKFSLKNQFHCSFRVRTIQDTATLLYASGKSDYNILEIFEGTVQYRFEVGTEEAAVSVKTVNISDGKWHLIMLDRTINNVKLIVDEKYSSEGRAPDVNIMYNTYNNDIFFGAEVKRSKMVGFDEIRRGFKGCLADLHYSFVLLPLHRYKSNSIISLKKFNNIDFTCNISKVLISLGKCASQPCQNGGLCQSLEQTFFQCKCPPRYSGKMCEFDLNPCISMPCLNGGLCQYVHLGNYSCICPSKLSGRRCEYGKFCNPNPCKNGGLCEEGELSSHCICRGYMGTTCEIDINECDNNPCEKGTICLNKPGSYQCICSIYNNGSSCIDLLYINSISKFKTIIIDQTTSLIAGIGLIIIVVLVLLYTIVSKGQACKIKSNAASCEKTITKVNSLKIKHIVNNLMPPINENAYIPNSFVNDLDIVRSYGVAADELERESLEFQESNQTHQQHNIILCGYTDSDIIAKNIIQKKQFKTFRENKLNYDSSNQHVYRWDFSDVIQHGNANVTNLFEVTDINVLDRASLYSHDSNESKDIRFSTKSAAILELNNIKSCNNESNSISLAYHSPPSLNTIYDKETETKEVNTDNFREPSFSDSLSDKSCHLCEMEESNS